MPGIGLDLSGDPTGCIRSVELFTNTAEVGGWVRSNTYTWVSGMVATDSTGIVSSFGTLAFSAGKINFGSEGCLIGLTPVQDELGDVQSVVFFSKEVTVLYSIPVDLEPEPEVTEEETIIEP